MTHRRKEEIIGKVFYRHMVSMMRTLEECEDTHVIFQIGMEMGHLHKSLADELDKETEGQQSEEQE